MSQTEPIRELRLSDSLRVYVSDYGLVVLDQEKGDPRQISLYANEIDRLTSALLALKESAAAKEAAHDVVVMAEYRAAHGEEP
jgi:hypothetical protein